MTHAWFDDDFCSAGRAHARVISAEVPGVVTELRLQPGIAVRAGQPIALLESMKMEIPVLSDHEGRVCDLLVSVGDFVGAGDPVARLRCCVRDSQSTVEGADQVR